jgi:hypothetical protein
MAVLPVLLMVFEGIPGTSGGAVFVCPVGPGTGGVVVGPVGTVGDCGGATLSITMDVSEARGGNTDLTDSWAA